MAAAARSEFGYLKPLAIRCSRAWPSPAATPSPCCTPDRPSLRQQLAALGGIYGVDLGALLIFGGLLGWL